MYCWSDRKARLSMFKIFIESGSISHLSLGNNGKWLDSGIEPIRLICTLSSTSYITFWIDLYNLMWGKTKKNIFTNKNSQGRWIWKGTESGSRCQLLRDFSEPTYLVNFGVLITNLPGDFATQKTLISYLMNGWWVRWRLFTHHFERNDHFLNAKKTPISDIENDWSYKLHFKHNGVVWPAVFSD